MKTKNNYKFEVKDQYNNKIFSEFGNIESLKKSTKELFKKIR